MKTRIPTFLALAAIPATASAELLSQDSFSAYPFGELPSVDTSVVTGYAGVWTDIDFGNGEPSVTPGSLIYPDANYEPAGGHKVAVPHDITGGEIASGNSGRCFRLFDSPLVVTDATTGTLYLSLLFQSGQETGATVYQTLSLNNGNSDANRNFDIGIASDGGQTGTEYNFGVDNIYTTTGVAADAEVHLLVVKFDLGDTAASDSVTVWVDPVLGAGEPEGGTVVGGSDLTWDRLVLSDYDGNSCAWDEIRWGTTFDSVTTESFHPEVPTFTLQPAEFLFGEVGTNFSIPTTVLASPSPDFQWERSDNGSSGWTPVEGETQPVLTFDPLAFEDNGFYRLIASNSNGAATSDVSELVVLYPNPTITRQPFSIAAEIGSEVTFSVEASGIGELIYQWSKEFEEIPGATSATLVLSDVQAADEGQYDVEVTDPAGEADGEPATSVFSTTVTLSVFEPWSGLVSYEPFDLASGYAEGALPAQDPAVDGYIGAWTDVDSGGADPAVAAGNLIYGNPLYLGSSGDKVAVPTDITDGEITGANSGRAFRNLAAPLTVDGNTTGTRYLSFLFQSGQETGATTYQMLSLTGGATGNGIRPFDIGLTTDGGLTGTEYGFGVSGGYSSTGVVADASVHLVVVRFDLSSAAESDSVTVWIDPVLGSGDPEGGTLVSGANLSWNKLILSDYDGNSAAWDEIRWGSTFDSVTLGSGEGGDYAFWIALYPEVADESGFDEDPDGDGLANGVENYLGTDPGSSNPGIGEVEVDGSGNLVLVHSVNPFPATDLSASYRWSSDLATWNESGAEAEGSLVTILASPGTPTTGMSTVTANVSGDPLEKLFLRLVVTQNP